MSETQHTPGPWEVRQAPAINSQDYDIYHAGSPASSGKIARVPGRDGRHKTTVANARLIAAAPDLLAAAEAYINAETQADLDAAIEATKVAIAKARGKS